MDMKISGGIKYVPSDGDLYELEAYLPEDKVYVAVQHGYNDWSYSVSDRSMDVPLRSILECYGDKLEIRESKYFEVFKTLHGMICLMEIADDV